MKTILFLLSIIIFSNLSIAQPVIEWQNSLGGTGDDNAYSIQQTTDGGYIIAGYSDSNDGDVTGNHGGRDYWVVKIDILGNLDWQKSLGGTGDDNALSIQQTTDGGYIVAGGSGGNDGDVTGNHGLADYWVVKLNNVGVIDWQKSLGGTNWDYVYSIQQTTDGGYIVAGWSSSINGDVTGNHGNGDFWVVKLNSQGSINWQKSFGGTGIDFGNSIQQTTDGGYIVAGVSESNNGDVTGNHGLADYWVVKLDSVGVIDWQKCLGGTGDDNALTIQQTTDGGFVVVGYSESNDGDVTGNHGNSDYWVVKLSSNVGVNEVEHLNISNIFPNPTTGNITIDLGELKQGVKATLTNSLGQIILTKEYSSTDFINLNLGYPKGLYFLRLETQKEAITKKIIIE